jgi:LCP family protein required for cell wall assembly
VLGFFGLGAQVVAGLMSAVVFVSSGMLWWDWHHAFSNNINRGTAVPTDQRGPGETQAPGQSASPGATGSAGAPQKDFDGKDQNILIIGNDSREGLTAKQLAEVGTDANPGGPNTDTLMVMHVPADGSQVTVFSIPRDSYVDIPGYKKNKINGAYADGACFNDDGDEIDCSGNLTQAQQDRGMQVLIQTVHNLTGLYIDHYIVVSLYGFYTISEAVGPVTVCLADRWYDPEYEAGIDYPPGNVKLEGKLALAFVRERHKLPNGDFDRIKRQQAFISAVVRKEIGVGTLLHINRLSNLLSTAAKALTIDKDLKPEDLVQQLASLAAGNVRFATIPNGGTGNADGKDVVFVDPTEVQDFIREAIGVPPVATSTPSKSAGSAHSTTSPPSGAGGTESEPTAGSSDAGSDAPDSDTGRSGTGGTSTPSSSASSSGGAPNLISAADNQCVN